jgi:hypothetical protein
MIDTVKIKILGAVILDNSKFTPEYRLRTYKELSDTEKTSKRPVLNAFIYNRMSLDETYMPRIEVYEKLNKEEKKVYSDVSIEFSIPKLLFENNLEEINENSFELVRATIVKKLKTAGILVHSRFISSSTIKYIHFGKNIILPGNITMKDIIEEMKTMSMGKSFDSTYKVFKLKNTDEIFHFYNSSKEYIVYDKVRDILNKRYKSNDKRKTILEKEIIYKNKLENTEILRYEYRLKHHTQIKSEINGFLKKKKTEPVLFKDVFNEDLWEHIINKSWLKILNKNENQLSLIFNESEYKNTVRALLNNIKDSSGHNLNNILITLGLGYIANRNGLKFFRKECSRVFSKRTCEDRLNRKIDAAIGLLDSLQYPDSIQYVSEKIFEFKRITPLSLEIIV